MFAKLKEALLAVEPAATWHYCAPGDQPPEARHIVWAERGESAASWVNDRMKRQTIDVSVDYFTMDEDDGAIMRVQSALNAAGLRFRLDSAAYDPATGFVCLSWTAKVEAAVPGGGARWE